MASPWATSPPAEPEWSDGRRVVFGKVNKGRNIVDAMEGSGSGNGKTSEMITTASCGQTS